MNKTQIKINFHVHSTGSDGKVSPEEVVKEAIDANIDFICFTDHYKNPKDNATIWSRDKFFSKEYIAEVKRLQKAYNNKIDISFGVELDWYEKHQEWLKSEIAKNKFDYVLGSVHFLPLNDSYYAFDFGDGKDEQFMQIAEKFGSVENLIHEYYNQLRLMIKSKMYDAVGHFDYIKRYNTNEKIFSENSDFYKKEVITTLKELAKSGMAIEINLRGFAKSVQIQYPNLWILKEAEKQKIPLTIGGDSHKSGEIGQYLKQGYELAKQAGYKEIVRFKARKKITIPLL